MGRLRLLFSGLNADAILVTHLPNVRYLCGFSGSAGMLLVESSRSTLFTDSRYTFQAAQEVTSAAVHIAKKGLNRAVSEKLRSKGKRRRVAYAEGQVTVAQGRALQAAAGSGILWVPDGSAVEKLRVIKDSDELSRMQHAADNISAVFGDVLKLIRPGMTELQLAAAIEYAIKVRGGSGPSFETIVASGPHSAWAHACPSSNPLRKGELVVLDQGAIMRGYCSDMTRTIFVGRAPGKIRELYRAVLEAQAAAKAAIRPGVTAGAVDQATRSVLKRARLAQYFTHSTGHGLGLEVHEMPRLGKGETTILQEGMVVTVEPGVYLEGVGGIRIEDDVVVTAKGAVDLTSAPLDFLEL
jgi:Xaa-Pro aminopeptidase